MQQIDQKELEKIIEQYNNTDQSTIKENVAKFIDESPYKNQYIADAIGVDIQSIYAWRSQKKTGISFESAIKLCNVLEISIIELMK